MHNEKINWIWLPEWDAADKEKPVLALFLKTFELKAAPKQAEIDISADTRYKLYVNGHFAEVGPSRGDMQVWFYDQADIEPYLKTGENILAVQVLRYPAEYWKGNYGMFRTEYPGLYVRGRVTDIEENTCVLDADDSWKCRRDLGFQIVSESDDFAPLQIFENRRGDGALAGWMMPGYDCGAWLQALPYQVMSRAVSPGNLQPRTIPFMYRRPCRFDSIAAVQKSEYGKDEWERMMQRDGEIIVPAHTKEIVEVTAGEEMTAYINLAVQKGAQAAVTLLYSEGYVQDEHHKNLPIKKDRRDCLHGHLEGFVDHYQVAGYGTADIPEIFEPFWFRTFRYIRLEIETDDEALVLSRFGYTETGYPLRVQTKASASDKSLDDVWEISERTLRRCMHETYEDCPFYEQLQYAMDARSEILYTYAVSADDRLARKCMDDFKRSQRHDGLLNACYPSCRPNVIPGFSIYYIFMLYDHMMYFGDRQLLEEHLPTVFEILNYFHQNRTKEGYVAKIGGLNGKDINWSFIDWTPEWDDTTGVPAAVNDGPVTMESLLYIMGLQHTAAILDYLGQAEQAARYLCRAEEVQKSLRRHCTGRNGMLQDGPGVDQYSQHVQVFSILTETVALEQGRKNLETTLLYPDRYAQCSVAMAFYLFRALQAAGLYVWTQEYWNIWKRMLQKGLTTCVEDEVGERSDCHAWGALILYELPAVILGVQPASPGCQTVRICPQPGYLTSAEGNIMTPKGMVQVSWDIKNGKKFSYKAPAGLKIITETDALDTAVSYYK